MRILRDYRATPIRLTDERRAHILEHEEMAGAEPLIGETLLHPDVVVQSLRDERVSLYHRYYTGTHVGDKFLCVVVKGGEGDAFVLTAYFTDRVKKGRILWNGRS